MKDKAIWFVLALVWGVILVALGFVLAHNRKTAPRTLAVLPLCHYTSNGALPDPRCTPGALNPAVTQATIRRTICVSGWTSTIRPPSSVTGPEKIASMYLYGDKLSASAYEFDHLISLELGGAPNSPLNLWPEPHPSSFAKDIVENRLKREVCASKITLAVAQHAIATDWRTAP